MASKKAASLSSSEDGVESTYYLKLSDLPDCIKSTQEIETFLEAAEDFNIIKVRLPPSNGIAFAEVTFPGDINEFLQASHKFKKQLISVTLTDPPEQPSFTPFPGSQNEPDTIEVIGDNLSTDVLQTYFEGRRSGGNREKDVKDVTEIKKNVFHVVFESSEDAALVVGQDRHLIKKKAIQVRFLPPKQYDKKKLLFTNIPNEIKQDIIIVFIEGRLSLDDTDDFTIHFKSNYAILLFQQSYTDEELDEMIQKLTCRKIKGQHLLTVERCEVNHSIIVAGITNKAFTTEDALVSYFESSRSGGGDDVLERVEMLGKGRAKVTFNDPAVIERVLCKKHDKLGHNVSITECTVVDTMEDLSSSDTSENEPEEEEEETDWSKGRKRDDTTGEKKSKKIRQRKEEKIKHRETNTIEDSQESQDETDQPSSSSTKELPPTPIIPLTPIQHPLDPLLAKYVRLTSSVTESIQNEFHVIITIDDRQGIITITPTSSSPPDWKTKSVEMMLDVFSNTLIKVDISIPPEISGVVYPMVMKACNEGGLQYALGQGSNKVAIAGDLHSVMKLQNDIKELSGRLIKKLDQIEISSEDYAYLKGYALALIKQKHSSVKLQCNDDHSTLSLDGSVKDVSHLKDKLSQYLSHASIPVHLHPLIVEFLQNDTGRQVLESTVKPGSQVVPFFNQNVLHLLCPHDCAAKVETLVIHIQKEVSIKHSDLPESFQTHIAHTSKYRSFQDNLARKYIFSSTVDKNQLIIVSAAKDVETISRELMRFIIEECSVTKSITLKRGVWRLFHGPMEKKWTNLASELREKGIEIVSSSKPTVKKPFIQIKGEVQNVDNAVENILALQADVKERQIPISRPGICQYFFNDPQGQIVLRGLETEAKVCIEVGVSEEEQLVSDDVPKGIRRPQFERLCFGTTAEMKAVSVYIGDITEFNKAEVIVNAANDRLSHGAGVAKAIADKGGPVIQQDSTNYIRKRSTLHVGEAVLFNNVGNLPSSYQAIVHAVGPTWSHAQNTARDTALLRKAIRKSFDVAKNFSSIALPAVSSGLFGFPVDVCANTLFEAVVEFSQQESTSHLSEINFVIFPDNANEFLKAAEKHLKSFQCITNQQQGPTSTSTITTVDNTNDTLRRKRRGTTQGNVTTDATGITPNSTQSLSPSPSATPRITKPCNFIKITKGSIIDYQEEALVNTTDSQLGFGGFVAQALERAAGPALKQECDAIAKPVAVGSVTVTGGHRLKSKHIFHVVLPGYDGPNGKSEKILREVVKKCLAECTRRNISTLCMPSIGAGNLKYPNNIVARALIEEVSLYFEKNQGQTGLKFVHFVIFDEAIFKEFQSVHQGQQSNKVPVPGYQPSYSQTQNHSIAISNRQQWQSSASMDSFGQHPDHGKCSFSLPHNLKLELLKGDISCDDSDVIVNTTQEDLQLVGFGVAGALLKKGGPTLQAACNDAVRKGQRATNGKVVATIAPGELKCKSIFHISLHNTKKLDKIIQTCLEEANKSKYQSIAFPAIGTGVLRYPASEAAKDMVDALKMFMKGRGPKHVKVIRMVVFQKDTYDQFVSAFKSMGESSGGFLNYIYSGFKAVGSLFTRSIPSYNDDVDMEELDELEDNDDFDDLDEPDVAKLLVNNSEIVLHIFGESNVAVGRAEKRLTSVIDTQFTNDEVDDVNVASLTDVTVRELESFAQTRNVDIDIDRDPALHSVKLHGCLQDVLLVKDKVREAMSSYSVEKSKRAAADTLYKTIRWMRMTSQEEEYDYGEDLNYDIEEAYRNKKKTFDCNEDNFFINFESMEEMDKVTKKRAKVWRIDFTEVQDDIPKEWDPMPMDSQGHEKRVHLVTLPVGSKEYNTVETAFNKTMVKGNKYTQIVSIQRLQNPILYQQYVVRKREMDKRNPKGHVNERWLWHGTTFDTHDKINTQGFNRSFAGKNATVYGRGVYFARDASYSHRYTNPPDANGQRHMYYVQVLTGEFTVGNDQMIVPPAKNPQVDANIPFDATVDGTSNPSIFVVYNDAQNYPAYLVHYK